MARNIKSIFFFRSLVNRGVKAASREDSRAVPTAFMDDSDDYDLLTLGKRKIVALDDDYFGSLYYDDRIGRISRSSSNNNFDIYDLTQTPVLRSVESILQLMTVNGCDYINLLVMAATKFDVMIREEISLFEKYACMFALTKEDNEKFRQSSYKQRQLQMQLPTIRRVNDALRVIRSKSPSLWK